MKIAIWGGQSQTALPRGPSPCSSTWKLKLTWNHWRRHMDFFMGPGSRFFWCFRGIVRVFEHVEDPFLMGMWWSIWSIPQFMATGWRFHMLQAGNTTRNEWIEATSSGEKHVQQDEHLIFSPVAHVHNSLANWIERCAFRMGEEKRLSKAWENYGFQQSSYIIVHLKHHTLQYTAHPTRTSGWTQP